jgi:di/tricarboxylate transporter
MARSAGQPSFGLFEMAPVGLIVALIGALYLFLIGDSLFTRKNGEVGSDPAAKPEREVAAGAGHGDDAFPGDPAVFSEPRRFDRRRALLSIGVFVAVVTVAALGWLPIAASAFAGAVLLILTRVISAEEAYRGLRPEVLLLIAGMVVMGLSLEVTGLAASVSELLTQWTRPLGPLGALVLFYGVVMVLTEILSNAAVAVLVAPIAVALAESLGVDARPFLIALMLAGSNAFATPFGYQTNVLVFQMGGYSYMDFLRVGVPLNLITWVVAVLAIPVFFPF